MKHRLFAAALLSSATFAAPASAQNPEPDPGRNLAAACANCHGTNGQAREGMPALAGMQPARLAQLMHEFKSGTRPATVMRQIARGYTDEQVRLLAAYFSEQTAR